MKKFWIPLLLLVILSSSLSAQNRTFTLALAGDALITQKLSVYHEPEFLKLIQYIREADAAFVNLEMLFHDYESFPMHQSGGTYLRADPAIVQELVWAGFDMVSRANNHAGDYGVVGMQLTTKYVDQAGLVQAGVGKSLTEAREARFLETANGRVALVSCASHFPDHARAGKTRGDIPPRPGLNPLRFSTTYHLSSTDFRQLKKLCRSLGVRIRDEKTRSFRAWNQRFILDDSTFVQTVPHQEDLREIKEVVNNASRLADYTIVSLHSHDYSMNNAPAQFVMTFAHAMIDAGADVVVGHGPHVLRGIEIYNGKPIFYSLGNFIFQNETVLRLPPENYEAYNLDEHAHVADFNDARYQNDTRGFPSRVAYWESVLARVIWQDDLPVEVELIPITLGFGKPRTRRGRPILADKQHSEKIISELQKFSAPFGTEIEWQNGMGIIRIRQ